MNSPIFQNVPKCTFDQPLEFTPSEIGSLANSINILLKTTFLIGTERDLEETFQSLFDIAEEIAGVECCAYLSANQTSGRFEISVSRRVPSRTDQEPALFAPVEMARHFDKVIQLDAGMTPFLRSVCEIWRSASLAVFPLRREREFIGALVFGNPSRLFTASEMKLLWALSTQAENLLLQGRAVKTMSFYSFLDPLTHLYNRRYFNIQMEKEIFRSRRSGKPFSLLMIDLDDFKAYNDRFPPLVGDIALQEFSSLLQACIREVDTAARFGGNEFAIILFESDAEGARNLARRISERQKTHLFPGTEGTRTERISVSIGAATFPADSFDMQNLVNNASQALSKAKSGGGGKVCLYQDIADHFAASSPISDIPIQKIYGAAHSVVDMDAFLEILLCTAMQGLSSDRGSIVVITPQGDLTLRAAFGFGKGEEKFTPGSTLPAGAVTSWVMEHRQPLLVSGQDDMPLPKQNRKNSYRNDSFLSAPLLYGEKMLGAIHLANKQDRKPFTREDLKHIEPIFGEIAKIIFEGMTFWENIRSFSTSFLLSLANALEVRFPYLNGHGGRMVDLSVRVGTKLGLEGEELAALKAAAALHDVGIVGIPASILTTDRKLSDSELEATRKHPLLGAKLVERVPGMEETRRFILEHHEFMNGSGYPYGLKGEEISKAGRILSMAEFYVSITSERPHRGKLSPGEAAQLVYNNMDTLFDREVCLAFLEEI